MVARLASALIGLPASGVAQVSSADLARPEMEHFKALADVAADHLADDDGEGHHRNADGARCTRHDFATKRDKA